MKAIWIIGIAMAAELEGRVDKCSVDVHIITSTNIKDRVFVPVAVLRATEMFRQIGVPIRMRQGSPARQSGAACGPPIVVIIEASDDFAIPDAMAYALPYNKSGTLIHVFLDRIAHVNPDPLLVRALLAHVVVHEVTHVLQEIDRHSETGMMKAHWSSQDYHRIVLGQLPFAPEDLEFIRKGLARRFLRAPVDGVPGLR